MTTTMTDCELNCRPFQLASQFSTNRVDEDLNVLSKGANLYLKPIVS